MPLQLRSRPSGTFINIACLIVIAIVLQAINASSTYLIASLHASTVNYFPPPLPRRSQNLNQDGAANQPADLPPSTEP
ncbi:hypothetical protein BHE90_013932 [Fusarium euwallaceae]|uniref:Uncharacterized protein n=4 Tax=Fusarium solani species complex TaxID=232080 RepID=A0A3M2S1D9_9HYPO|nr:hypothetical protein CDV36_008965 [Fusarium kuroshium]RSL56737.1 hypothetical protein CEP51_014349 [Fusarium floridanum]RSL82041.1 hypothetical protein CEP52_017061 [Fusarium oligoseptatum]RTE71662.1 hypothetical protein BHE90_013932 [Fusarium euwallaceae]